MMWGVRVGARGARGAAAAAAAGRPMQPRAYATHPPSAPFPVHNPATGVELGRVANCGAADVNHVTLTSGRVARRSALRPNPRPPRP